MAIGTAAAIIGGTVLGSLASSDASRKAANTQADSARDANNTQLAMYDQNRADMQPWRDAGMTALADMVAGTRAGGDFNRDFTLADFQQDPGYQFRMDQGSNALQASAAARGGLLNGGTLKALTRYGQDYASGEYSNAYNRFNADRDRRFNRLSGLAGTAQTATRDIANMGSQVATNVGNNQMAAGNANASSYVGQANAVNNGIGSLQSLYYMNQMNRPGGAMAPAVGPGWAGGSGFGTGNQFGNQEYGAFLG